MSPFRRLIFLAGIGTGQPTPICPTLSRSSNRSLSIRQRESGRSTTHCIRTHSSRCTPTSAMVSLMRKWYVAHHLCVHHLTLVQWESWRATVRWPTNTTASAVSNGDAMDRNLSNNRLTLRDRTYNLLTQARDYEGFSNDGFPGTRANPTAFDSLESIHGQIHGMTGKNGHMGVVDFAAFDPVFWLHHTNVGS